MEFEHDRHYEASVERVIQVVTTPELMRRKYEALGHRDVKILEHSVEDGVIRLKVRRLVPMDVPAIARKVLGPTNTVIQSEHWDALDEGAWRCRWKVDASGTPVRLEGETKLSPEGEGCGQEIRGKVSVSIPIIGRKVAAFVAGDAVKSMDDEYEENVRLLAE